MSKLINNHEGDVRTKIITNSSLKLLENEINEWLKNHHVTIIGIRVISNSLAYIVYYI